MGNGMPLLEGNSGVRWFFPMAASSFLLGCTPLPPPGHFGRKILCFNDLHGDDVCKILKTNGLRTKYFLSMS